MRYLAAYMLAVLGGNENPSENDIRRILSSVGIEADDICLKKVITQLRGKNIEELIIEGKERLATMPAGGGHVFPIYTPPSEVEAEKEAPPEVFIAKVDQKKIETLESESDEDLGFGLFD